MTMEPKANVFVSTVEEAAKGAPNAVADGSTGTEAWEISAESIAVLHYVLLGANCKLSSVSSAVSLLSGELGQPRLSRSRRGCPQLRGERCTQPGDRRHELGWRELDPLPVGVTV